MSFVDNKNIKEVINKHTNETLTKLKLEGSINPCVHFGSTTTILRLI